MQIAPPPSKKSIRKESNDQDAGIKLHFCRFKVLVNAMTGSKYHMARWKVACIMFLSGICLKHCVAFQYHKQQQRKIRKSSQFPSNNRMPRDIFMKNPTKEKKVIDIQINEITTPSSNDFDDEVFTEEKETVPTSAFRMLALCWGIAFLSALDRVAMSVAMLPLSQEFGYTDSMKGQVSSTFSIGYGLAILPCGILLSVASPKKVMATGIALWSIATLATPITAGMVSMGPLLTARAAVGAAESVVLPSIQRLLSSWASPSQISIAVAVIFSGFQCGTVGAYILSPQVMDIAEGWRGLFYTYGAVGLLALVPWIVFAEDSPNNRSAKETSPNDTSSLDEVILTVQSAPWNDMIQSSGVQAILLAHAASHWGLYINLAWSPTFYAEQYGLNVRDSAFLSVLPSVAGAIGGILAGAAADKIMQSLDHRTDDAVTRVRKTFQAVSLFGPAICLGTLAWHIPEQAWVAQSLLTGTVCLQAFNAAGYGSGVQEKAGEKW